MLRFILNLLLAITFAQPALATRNAHDELTPVLIELQKADARVATIAYRLATRGVSLCPLRQALPGLTLHSIGQYSQDFRPAARAAFGLGFSPALAVVVPGGAADRAGLRVGDALTAIGGVVHQGSVRVSRGGSMDAVTAAYLALERGLLAPPARLTLTRLTLNGSGQPFNVELTGVMGCKSRIELVPSGKLNAKADGEIVQITTAVLEETRDDSELAFIIAHEMAHNVLGHPQMLRAQGRKASRVLATEIEADRFAIKLMHKVGYDPGAAARFWTRFGKKTGAGIFSDGTHQRTKDRVRTLENEARLLTQ
jgi:beta-barrel assembly-enhancing protease